MNSWEEDDCKTSKVEGEEEKAVDAMCKFLLDQKSRGIHFTSSERDLSGKKIALISITTCTKNTITKP